MKKVTHEAFFHVIETAVVNVLVGFVLLVGVIAFVGFASGKVEAHASGKAGAHASGRAEAHTYSESRKPLLLFEIDEGFRDEVIYSNRNDDEALTAALERIYESLRPLLDRYEVGVLIYPVVHYDRDGFETDGPLRTIHPSLQKTLGFFEEAANRDGRGIRFFLEVLSSGNFTKQSGEIDDRPPAPLYLRPDEPGRKGLSIDIDTARAIKEAFPNAFGGIRFHELFGTDFNLRIGHHQGYPIESDVIRAWVDASRDLDLRLIWSDSNWLFNYHTNFGGTHYIDGPRYTPYYEMASIRQLIDYAVDQLGPRLLLTYANNNYHPGINLENLSAKAGRSRPGVVRPLPDWLHQNLPYDEHPIKFIDGADWGVSVQSWFWSEMVHSLTGKYYVFAELDMPYELMRAFVGRALRQGAGMIQFEPPWYLFDSLRVSTTTKEQVGQPTHALKRLVADLIDTGWIDEDSADPSFFFDDDLQRLMENDVSAPPLSYAQSTLIAFGHDPERQETYVRYRDFYRNGDQWLDWGESRIPDLGWDDSIAGITRMAVNGSGDDWLLVLRQNDRGQVRGYVYDHDGRLRGTPAGGFPIQLPTPGRIVGVTAANLMPRVVFEGDPDELIILIEANGKVSPTVYQMVDLLQGSSSTPSYVFQPMPKAQGDRVLQAALGIPLPDRLVGLAGVRTSPSLRRDLTRPQDRLVMVHEAGDELVMVTRDLDTGETTTYQLTGDYVKRGGTLLMTGLDTDLDGREKVAILAFDHADAGSPAAGWAVELLEIGDAHIQSLGLRALDHHAQGGGGGSDSAINARSPNSPSAPIGLTAMRKVILLNAP